VDDATLALRNATYALFVELGRAPAAREVADRLRVPEGDVEDGWRGLHDAHALVIDASSGGIRMANPFSAVPTPFRVQAAGRSWYANCAWDAFGICAALAVDGSIETRCPDCGAPITVAVRGRQPTDESLLFHCLVPASQWWDDIVYT
jgi:hypothetical protein